MQYQELATRILLHLYNRPNPTAPVTTGDLAKDLSVENGVFFETCVNQCRDMGFVDVRGGSDFGRGHGRSCLLTSNGVRKARALQAQFGPPVVPPPPKTPGHDTIEDE